MAIKAHLRPTGFFSGQGPRIFVLTSYMFHQFDSSQVHASKLVLVYRFLDSDFGFSSPNFLKVFLDCFHINNDIKV